MEAEEPRSGVVVEAGQGPLTLLRWKPLPPKQARTGLGRMRAACDESRSSVQSAPQSVRGAAAEPKNPRRSA